MKNFVPYQNKSTKRKKKSIIFFNLKLNLNLNFELILELNAEMAITKKLF